MNRRQFFRSFAVLGVAAAAPPVDLFLSDPIPATAHRVITITQRKLMARIRISEDVLLGTESEGPFVAAVRREWDDVIRGMKEHEERRFVRFAGENV